LTLSLRGGPLNKSLLSLWGQKLNFEESKVVYMQKNRLEATVSTKQTKIQSKFFSPRYGLKHGEICWFGLDDGITARFCQYLEAKKSDLIYFSSLEPWLQAKRGSGDYFRGPPPKITVNFLDFQNFSQIIVYKGMEKLRNVIQVPQLFTYSNES
jgi:hypothetical protein